MESDSPKVVLITGYIEAYAEHTSVVQLLHKARDTVFQIIPEIAERQENAFACVTFIRIINSLQLNDSRKNHFLIITETNYLYGVIFFRYFCDDGIALGIALLQTLQMLIQLLCFLKGSCLFVNGDSFLGRFASARI